VRPPAFARVASYGLAGHPDPSSGAKAVTPKRLAKADCRNRPRKTAFGLRMPAYLMTKYVLCALYIALRAPQVAIETPTKKRVKPGVVSR